MIKVAVSGACGKMGQRIINLLRADKTVYLACALENSNHSKIGQTIDNVELSCDPTKISNCDVLIEFTNPEVTISHLDYVEKYKKKMVIGTTGLTKEQVQEIEDASSNIAIVFSPNMSVGVNVLFDLVKNASKKLKDGYCIKIIEAHHVHKKDAPSGTAKRITQIIKDQRCNVEDIKSIREDEIVGEHKVIFEGPYDKIELFHSAKSRDIFAKGAIEAAKWIINKSAGLYSMQDVLGRKDENTGI